MVGREGSSEWFAEQNVKKVGPNHQVVFMAVVARQRISRLFVLASGCSDCRQNAAGSEWNRGETTSSWQSDLSRDVPLQGVEHHNMLCMWGMTPFSTKPPVQTPGNQYGSIHVNGVAHSASAEKLFGF